jgi:hypothetical protein
MRYGYEADAGNNEGFRRLMKSERCGLWPWRVTRSTFATNAERSGCWHRASGICNRNAYILLLAVVTRRLASVMRFGRGV